ncbi:MAG TPA: class I SAM-dependent methyltransferase [Planctomycetaceae bacterium]|nr:class I SAM-dependent methyltransferase [Planctomycetaceae bacterium]
MPETNTTATAGFQNAAAYEQVMGRWSRRLAPLLIRFGGLSDGDRVLDVGCGTGSLTFTVPEIANVASITGIDLTEPFVEFARARNTDPRISFQSADARVLPFEDNSFDRAFSMLVLQFIPDAARAVAEMRRAVRPGGTVTAAVWDNYGGQPHVRMVWDIAAVLDPSFKPPFFRPLTAPDEMATLWRELGLLDVEQTSLLIRMEFSCFDDYWLPLTSEGPVAHFLGGLSASSHAVLTEHVQRAYIADRPDGPRSFACVAWACRGTVPA